MGKTQGQRKYPDADGKLYLAEGEYGCDGDGLWVCRPPGQGSGSLDGHNVVEHEDGTITVSPSIVGSHWHGYLKAGVWEEC